MPAPTPSAGLPQEYAASTIALPPVAKIVATPGCFISAEVPSIDGFSIHWIQFSGAPAAIAASRTIRAAWAEHCWADGWNEKIIGLRVFSAIRDLKMVVEVGLVVGTIPQTTPTGSAISVIPVTSFSLMTPTVFKSRRRRTTFSQANRFFVALSSNTPRPVSSTACMASTPCLSSAAIEALATIKSICS